MKLYQATSSFAVGTDSGVPRIIEKGTHCTEGDPILKGREHLFVPLGDLAVEPRPVTREEKKAAKTAAKTQAKTEAKKGDAPKPAEPTPNGGAENTATPDAGGSVEVNATADDPAALGG